MFSINPLILVALSAVFLFGCSEKEETDRDLWLTCFNHYRAESYLVASEICRQAADLGIKRAQWLLGHIYYYDLAEQSTTREQGFSWYLKSAENGWIEAQTFVGESYLYADGVEEDFNQAFYWLTKAAQYGEPNAEFALGMMFYQGSGRNKDLSSAIFWFKKAAQKKHLMSINNLAWIYATSHHQSFRNANKAMFWIEHLDAQIQESQQQPIFLDTKAAAHALAKDFESAIELQIKAISLLSEDVEESQLIEFQQHLEAYQNNQAWLENE